MLTEYEMLLNDERWLKAEVEETKRTLQIAKSSLRNVKKRLRHEIAKIKPLHSRKSGAST